MVRPTDDEQIRREIAWNRVIGKAGLWIWIGSTPPWALLRGLAAVTRVYVLDRAANTLALASLGCWVLLSVPLVAVGLAAVLGILPDVPAWMPGRPRRSPPQLP